MNSEHIGDEAGRASIVAAPLPRAKQPRPFDPRKPVMTRCGWAARIISIDRDDPEMPIVALTLVRPGHGEGVSCYRADGRYGPSSYPIHNLDLVNVIAGRGFKKRPPA